MLAYSLFDWIILSHVSHPPIIRISKRLLQKIRILAAVKIENDIDLRIKSRIQENIINIKSRVGTMIAYRLIVGAITYQVGLTVRIIKKLTAATVAILAATTEIYTALKRSIADRNCTLHSNSCIQLIRFESQHRTEIRSLHVKYPLL